MRDPDPERQLSFLDEELTAERRETRRDLLRWSLGFALLFAAVFFAFWWSGSAVRFGASRVADTSVPTYRVVGVVRNAHSGEPIAWAKIEDDPSGQPPFYRTDADDSGRYTLLTLAEPHRIRVTAPGYRTATLKVGPQWFIWWPKGEETRDISLAPE